MIHNTGLRQASKPPEFRQARTDKEPPLKADALGGFDVNSWWFLLSKNPARTQWKFPVCTVHSPLTHARTPAVTPMSSS